MPRRGSGTEYQTQRRQKLNPLQEGEPTDAWGRKRKGQMETMVKREVDPETNKPDMDDPGTEVEVFVPPDAFRCRARALSGPFMGQRCRAFSIKGGFVCMRHGGSLPNVKKAAQARLLMAANPAIEKLIEIAITKKGVDDADRLRAIAQILDRAGIVGRQEVAIEIKPWQEAIKRLLDEETEGSEEAPEASLDLVEGQDFWVDYDQREPGEAGDEMEQPDPPRGRRRQPRRARADWDDGSL